MLTLVLFAALSVALTHTDSQELRLPNRLLGLGTLTIITSDVVAQVATPNAIYGAGIAFVFGATLRAVSPDGLGMGDVKLLPLLCWVVVIHAGSEFLSPYAVLASATLFLNALWKRTREGKGAVFAAGPILIVSVWAVLFYAQLA
ncbi:MAG: prepilin peptidase [Canibacter sp.]